MRATLAELLTELGDRPAVLARELTKKFEEFRRGSLSELVHYYETAEPRGEFVIVVAGAAALAVSQAPAASRQPAELVQELMAGGLDKKAAMREAAKQLNISRRDVYQAVLAAEKQA